MNENAVPIEEPPRERVRLFSIVFHVFCVCFFLIFSALGVWQVQRLSWKVRLISAVDQRVHLLPVRAPPENQWAHVTFEDDEYKPVVITGKFLTNKNILVTAAAQNTTGYWVLTPLKTDDNTLVFVNRGFIPMDVRRDFQEEKKNVNKNNSSDPHSDTNVEEVTIIGLLRMSEKDGLFLRKNNPDRNLWYTRQLPSMAKKLGLSSVAPYFIDAHQIKGEQAHLPITGLTVVQFRNHHLVYAITWFILAAGVLGSYLAFLKRRD